MGNIHKENLKKWHDLYIENAIRVAPRLHSAHNIFWTISDSSGGYEENEMRVGLTYNTEYIRKKPNWCQKESPESIEYRKLFEAFRIGELSLGFSLENCFPWSILGDKVKISYGKIYTIPIEDLSSELQIQRKRLIERKEKMSEVYNKIGEMERALKNLNPAFFESEKNVAGLEEKLSMIGEIKKISLEISQSSFKSDVKKYGDNLLNYLGLPADAPEYTASDCDWMKPHARIEVNRHLF